MSHRSTLRRRAAAVTSVILLVSAAAACGGDDDDTSAPATDPAPAAPEPSQPATTDPDASDTSQPSSTSPGATAPSASDAAPADGELDCSGDPTRIRMVYTSSIVSYLPFHVAELGGIFEKYGIEYSGIKVDTDADAIRALVGGEAEMISGVPEPFVNAYSTGVDLRVIASNLNYNIYNLFGSEGMTSLADLVGEKFAVYTLSNTTYFLARWALDQEGLDSNNVEYVVVGSQPARLAALQEGQVAGTIIALPQAVTAEEEGMPVLARFSEIPEASTYPMTVSVTTGKLIEENPQALLCYKAALVEAIEFIHANTDEALEMGVAGMGGELEALRTSLDLVIDRMDGNLEPIGLQFAIDIASTYGESGGEPPTVDELYWDGR